MTQANLKTAVRDLFTMTRVVDAPRDIVWKAWTEQNQAKQWFGPKGSTVSYSRFDVKAGGMAHYSMDFEGTTMWGKWSYRAVEPPQRLIAIVAFTDKEGVKNITHPGMANWPRETLSTVDFIARGNKTEIVVQWEPYNATPEEQEVFANNHASMEQGWGGTFDRLDEFLAKQR